jgi:hypothetical protein
VTRPWHWFAFRPEPPPDAFVVAPAYGVDGSRQGFLAGWRVGAGRRPAGALGIDARAIDPTGESAWISLALAPEGLHMPFDDPAICQAMRVVLAGQPLSAMSTLVRDASTIGGAFTAVQAGKPITLMDEPPIRLMDDPFARIFPRRLLLVDRGLVGTMPAPTGPGVQRYAGSPWPWDHF